jgi:hypothetical protein
MNTTLPIVLALLPSACFGLALVVAQFGLRHVAATAGALVAIPTMTVLLWLLCPFWLDAGGWHLGAAAIFALVGLFFPALVTLLTYEANQRMGPTITASLGGTAPVFAAGADLPVPRRAPDGARLNSSWTSLHPTSGP